MFFVVKNDHGRAQGGGVTRIEGRIPLLVLGPETDNDQIGLVDQLASTDTVNPGTQAIFQKRFSSAPRMFTPTLSLAS